MESAGCPQESYDGCPKDSLGCFKTPGIFKDPNCPPKESNGFPQASDGRVLWIPMGSLRNP
eukprot:5019769-Pyramimonas_sp.AAC.1